MKKKQKLPKGLTEEKVREIIDCYENQTEEEAVAEIEAAFDESRYTFVQVPNEFVHDVELFIQERMDAAERKSEKPKPASRKVSETGGRYAKARKPKQP